MRSHLGRIVSDVLVGVWMAFMLVQTWKPQMHFVLLALSLSVAAVPRVRRWARPGLSFDWLDGLLLFVGVLLFLLSGLAQL